MNVTQLINEIARRTKKTRYQLMRPEVEQAITLMVEILGEEMSKPNGKFSIDNFGILEVQRRVRKMAARFESVTAITCDHQSQKPAIAAALKRVAPCKRGCVRRRSRPTQLRLRRHERP